MRNERLAEAVLSIVTPREYAAATVGDLLELMPARGRRWFWASVLGTMLSTVWRQYRETPWRLTLYAAVAAVGYVLTLMLLLAAIFPLAEMLWMGGDVLAHHPRVLPLAHALGLDGAWGSLPQAGVAPIFFLITFVLAPYLAGRRVADVWKERGIALTLGLVVVWVVMLAIAPMAASFGVSVRAPMLPSLLPFMVTGVIRGRLVSRASSEASRLV